MPKNIPPRNEQNWSIKAQLLGNSVGELMIYGDIVDERWWDDEQCVVPKEVDDEIKKLGSVSQLNVRINSYGGSVYAGNAIATMIDRYKAKGCKVTSYIDGIAASMGSVIAMVGDDIVMAENATMMIHKPSTIAWGNANDFQKVIERLDTAEKTLISLYMRHFNGTEDELKTMLADETWLTGKEAYDCGLCTILEGSVDIAASANGFVFNGLNVPKDILAKATAKIKPTKEGGEKEMFLNEEIQNKIQALIEDGKEAVISKADDGSFVVGEVQAAQEPEPVTPFLTAEQVRDKVGKDMTADEVLAAFDTIAALENEAKEAKAKATEYDKLRKEFVDEALNNGVRAKGDRFDRDRWEKVLSGFSIEEIRNQSAEWFEDAKESLHAGYRASSPNGKKDIDTTPDEAYKA